jgi:hypothetical protein
MGLEFLYLPFRCEIGCIEREKKEKNIKRKGKRKRDIGKLAIF